MLLVFFRGYQNRQRSPQKSAKSAREGTSTVFPEFPISVIRGTGRFEGATGDGTQTAVRVAPIAVGVHLIADVVLNVKK